MRRRVGRRRRRLLERRDVVEHVQAAAVGRDRDIVKLLLHHDPAHRRVRQAGRQLGPVAAVVGRVEEAVAGAGEDHPGLVRVLRHRLDVRQRMRVRQIAVDPLPGRAVVGGLEDVRLAAVHQVRVDGHVRRAAVEVRRLDLRDHAPRRQAGHVLRDVVPLLRRRRACTRSCRRWFRPRSVPSPPRRSRSRRSPPARTGRGCRRRCRRTR